MQNTFSHSNVTRQFPVIEVPNIQFSPEPTEYGKCSLVKVNVYLDSTLFVAGGVLHGRMELDCLSATKVKISQISVHLTGAEGKHQHQYNSLNIRNH